MRKRGASHFLGTSPPQCSNPSKSTVEEKMTRSAKFCWPSKVTITVVVSIILHTHFAKLLTLELARYFRTYLPLGAGTRSRIQARLSRMNIHHARTSKLVSDFLYLERSLVHNSAHAAHVPARLQASWARV